MKGGTNEEEKREAFFFHFQTENERLQKNENKTESWNLFVAKILPGQVEILKSSQNHLRDCHHSFPFVIGLGAMG